MPTSGLAVTFTGIPLPSPVTCWAVLQLVRSALLSTKMVVADGPVTTKTRLPSVCKGSKANVGAVEDCPARTLQKSAGIFCPGCTVTLTGTPLPCPITCWTVVQVVKSEVDSTKRTAPRDPAMSRASFPSDWSDRMAKVGAVGGWTDPRTTTLKRFVILATPSLTDTSTSLVEGDCAIFGIQLSAPEGLTTMPEGPLTNL